jgi:septal ring factor EnvC (AmiA/AmiB activator)
MEAFQARRSRITAPRAERGAVRGLALPLMALALAGLPIAGSTQAPAARRPPDRPSTAATPATPPSAAAAALQQLNIRQATLDSRIGAARNRLARLYSALQRYSRDPPPPLLTPPAAALDSVRAAILIRALTPPLERQVRTLQAQERALAAQRRLAAAANGERFAAESAQADMQRVDGLIAASQAGARAAPTGPLRLSAPVEGQPTARFGGQLAAGGASRGLEYSPPSATPVVSPAQGVVEYAGPLDGWGRVLILRGAGGYHMVLAGLSTLVVQPGQSVASGQTIGAMPMSDNPAPHLYLEVRRGDDPVDPAPLLAQTRR